MKTFTLALLVTCVATSGQTYRTGLAERGFVDYTTDPFRAYAGKVVDFSAGIKWRQSEPGNGQQRSRTPFAQRYGSGSEPGSVAGASVSGYDPNSPLDSDWKIRKAKFDSEGVYWKKYWLDGTVREMRAEGIIIDQPFVTVKQVVSGSMRIAGTSQYMPTYETVTEHHTKQVLLMNAPSSEITLPIFAIPVVGRVKVGVVSLEAWDYGTPVNSPVPPTPQTTNAPISKAKSASNEIRSQTKIKGERISGKIIHITDRTLLINIRGRNICLEDFPAVATSRVDDTIDCVGYAVGNYTGSAVNNAEKTVPKYTCDIKKALSFGAQASNKPAE